jgi:hypothetical protein
LVAVKVVLHWEIHLCTPKQQKQ